MTAGVIVNASAGSFQKVREKLTKLEEIFEKVVTGPGSFGEVFFENAEVIDIPRMNFLESIERLTIELSKTSDVLVSVGGDGTANMVASTLLKIGKRIPLMGIAAGTANVGPLLRFSLESIEKPSGVESVNCLEIRNSEKKLGYAFVDVVFGDTFLGTVDGNMRNLSVEAFLMEGKKIPKEPLNIVSRRLEITSDGRKISHKIEEIAQVIVSPVNFSRFYIGKAITGALCWAHFFDRIGALVVSNKVIVDSNLDDEASGNPVLLEQVLFKDELKISGFHDGVYVVIDGNPVCEARGEFVFRVLKNCVDVLVGERCYPIGGFET